LCELTGDTMVAKAGLVVRALVGFVYPSYQSLQAVLSEDKEDDLTWLRYWVVLSVVHLVELVIDPLVDFFPGYLLAKCAFLFWCMAPVQNNGANMIFSQVIFPLFKKHHGKIDQRVQFLQGTIRARVSGWLYGQVQPPKSRWW